MELIKSVMRWAEARREDESLPRHDHSRLPASYPPCARDTSFPVVAASKESEVESGKNVGALRDGGAEMFSVDCSLHRRKFALSFSL